MATVHPFKGLRPSEQYVNQVISPPYDVMNRKEAIAMVDNNPYSFLRVVRPEVNLDSNIDLYDESVYQAGADSLRKFVEDKVLIRDSENYFYIYRQQMGDHIQTGLVAGASAQEYDEDIIKKHEFTRADKEEDRVKHVKYLNANTGPVFLAYRSRPEVDSLLEKATQRTPIYDLTTEDGIKHTFWVVKDVEMINEIEQAFKNVDYLYVADGHHRSASGARVARMRKSQNPCHSGFEEYNFFLSVIFPHNQLKIMDYNRVVKDLNGLTKEDFLNKIKVNFNIVKSQKGSPSDRHKISMYLDKEWFTISPKEGTYPEDDPVKSLDVSILQENLLSPILGIGDPRKDKRIDFVGGIRGLDELEKRVEKGWKVAFAMYPTSMDELMSIADASKTMPPKSTWFEPKLRSGIIIHSLD